MLRLERPNLGHREGYEAMMTEWKAEGGRIYPGAIRREGPYAAWLAGLETDRHEETCPAGKVPQHVFFSVGEEGRLVGAVAIRRRLNERLRLLGGHIGYGIRPSERGHGLAKEQLALALRVCREELGIGDALITCDKDNPASAGVILANGGVLENEVADENGDIVQRYWIYEGASTRGRYPARRVLFRR